jgi:SAM-dependent methyltransferase
VAQAILGLYGKSFPSLRSLISEKPLNIYNTASSGAFHKVLQGHPTYTCSEYFPGLKPGALKDGVQCQDIQNLTFEDNVFDIVITEDLLEHVPDYEKAFHEIFRVLKRGGSHVFTVPLNFGNHSVTRAVQEKGITRHLLPQAYHSDTIRPDILVFTDFGRDLFDRLETWGFTCNIALSSYRDLITNKITDSYVFTTVKI